MKPQQQQVSSTTTFQDPTGKYKLVQQGAFSCVEVAITAGDTIKAEHGCMLTLSNNVQFSVRREGSVGNMLCLCCFGGEFCFLNHYELIPGAGYRGDILLAPSLPGEVAMLTVTPEHSWSVQQTGFVACDQTVNIGVRVQTLTRCCCAGEGFVILKCSGAGRLLVNSFGSIVKYDVAPGEVRVVDNGALVAWSDHMQPDIKLAATGVASSLFSGEGFVCSFTGPGTIFVQTRTVKGLGTALAATGLRRKV